MNVGFPFGEIVLFTRLRGILRVISYFLRVFAKTRSLTFVRLFWHEWRTPGRMPGVFCFPFGRMRYTDAASLLFMYREIFLDHAYDVAKLPRAPRIIDCGGNIGLSAVWFMHCYPEARLTVFEADPVFAEILDANMRTVSGCIGVDVIHAAVSTANGMTSFACEGTLSGHVDSHGACSIPSVRLSDYMTETVDLLKMDIEGSEFAVISDLCATGAIDRVQALICEVHANHSTNDRIGALWSALTGAGFRVTLHREIAEVTDYIDPTPFVAAPSGAFACILYAWRSDQSVANMLTGISPVLL